ncbi:MAG TPA: PKD domain-containing protein, partial [Bacteroidia bacterium]|nr:PKD domain-containing protein [Bacteroidia bacterium]
MLFALTAKAQLPIDTTGQQTQSWTCGINPDIWKVLNSDPDIINARVSYDTSVTGVIARSSYSVTPSYTIPVVFHVISTSTSTTTLSYDRIKWEVATLNAAFQDQLVALRGGTVGEWNNNANIHFVLACNSEPLGIWTNSNEPGVMRYATSNTSILNQGLLDPTSYGPMLNLTNTTSAYFPKSDYLNIYCVQSIPAGGSGTVLGYATFPWMNNTTTYASTTYTLDGIVMRTDIIGNNSYPTNFPMFPQVDKGLVLAHEAGHYLGLYHTFETCPSPGTLPVGCFGTGGTNNPTTYGDLIPDTPPTEINADLGNILTINSCNSETYQPYINYTGLSGYLTYNQNDQLENIMCYSDDDKLNTFTKGQASRMAATFTTSPSRANLVSASNLTARGVNTWPTSCAAYTGIVTGIFNHSIAQNSTCTNIIINFLNPTNQSGTSDFSTPSTTTYSWTFGDGGTAYTPNPTHTYTAQSNFTVTCTATNGSTVNTYSTVISTVMNVSIVGQNNYSGSSTTSTVCRGTEQSILVQFPRDVPWATITDGTTQYNVENYMDTSKAETIPYTITANSSASYSIYPVGCGGGVATFNVIDCCPTILTNGDFESTTTYTGTNTPYGFNTDLAVYGGSGGVYGSCQVGPISSFAVGNMGTASSNIASTGNAMGIDGPGFSPACGSSYQPR